MERYKNVKLHCLEAARNSWQVKCFPPYVIGFKNSESFMMMMPSFISNREMINQFLDTVSSEEEWDSMAFFNHTGDGDFMVTLILPDGVFVSKAEIINDFGGLSLGDFSKWQDVNDAGDENISLNRCLSRDVGNAIQKRMKNYG